MAISTIANQNLSVTPRPHSLNDRHKNAESIRQDQIRVLLILFGQKYKQDAKSGFRWQIRVVLSFQLFKLKDQTPGWPSAT